MAAGGGQGLPSALQNLATTARDAVSSSFGKDTAATDIDPASITLPGEQPTAYTESRRAGEEATRDAARTAANTHVDKQQRARVMHDAVMKRLGVAEEDTK